MTSLFLPLALAVAASSQAAPSDEALASACTALVASNAQAALQSADEWRLRGGGLAARQCLGLAYTALERWAPAAAAFEQGAREAERLQDPRRAGFWAQSGNAWLAAGDAAQARAAFDSALATTDLAPAARGEVHLDHARADVMLADQARARAEIDRALALLPGDPYAWHLSAALALRQGESARAVADIARAVEMAPQDPEVLVQAGTIAGTIGDVAAARGFYERAVAAAPASDAAARAKAALGD